MFFTFFHAATLHNPAPPFAVCGTRVSMAVRVFGLVRTGDAVRAEANVEPNPYAPADERAAAGEAQVLTAAAELHEVDDSASFVLDTTAIESVPPPVALRPQIQNVASRVASLRIAMDGTRRLFWNSRSRIIIEHWCDATLIHPGTTFNCNPVQIPVWEPPSFYAFAPDFVRVLPHAIAQVDSEVARLPARPPARLYACPQARTRVSRMSARMHASTQVVHVRVFANGLFESARVLVRLFCKEAHLDCRLAAAQRDGFMHAQLPASELSGVHEVIHAQVRHQRSATALLRLSVSMDAQTWMALGDVVAHVAPTVESVSAAGYSSKVCLDMFVDMCVDICLDMRIRRRMRSSSRSRERGL